jgi:transcriptional regulator of acetoin/glycerol metabolism
LRTFPRPSSRLERRRAIDRAWLLYVQDGIEPTQVGEEVARSWRRVRTDYRIDPEMKRAARTLTPEQLHRRCARDEGLRLARPILADFAGRLGLTDHVLTYFDAEGWMLSIDGTPSVVESLSAIDFQPGACWAEDSAGTNGPGTALAEGRPVEIFASEHFVAAWQPWSCAAAPVMAPGVRGPVGIVDITGPWEVQRRQALVAAKAIARAIEERLRAAVSVREEVMRYAFRTARGSGDALVAIDGRGAVVALNDAAARRGVLEAGALPPGVRESVLQAFSAQAPGASDFPLEAEGAPALLVSPVTHEGAVIGAILRAQAPGPGRARPTPAGATTRYRFGSILGASLALGRAVELARVASRNTLPVALLGESGTGKELFAHAIHAASDRAGGPFVPVNCGSIPSPLVEAELFGYEAGTFTGGRRDGSPGRFEDADGGSLFLDEVSELSGPAQTALLRVLQEREVVRLGGSAPRQVDVRIIAASNKPLQEEVAARRFRRDLFYRLHVLNIEIPPLRERSEDVAPLAEGFLARAGAEVGRTGLRLSEAALAVLRAYSWPGNVRELNNVILRAAATARGPEIGPSDLQLVEDLGAPPGGQPSSRLRRAVLDSERAALQEALRACGGNLSRAAVDLGISRMTLYRRMARCGLARDGSARPPVAPGAGDDA